MAYKVFKTPNALKNHIQYVWCDDLSEYGVSSGIRISKFAEKSPRLFFHCPKNGSDFLDSEGKELPTSFVEGINTGLSTVTLSKDAYIIGVCFFPDAIKDIFNVSPEEFKNNKINLSYLKADDFLNKLIKADALEERLQIIYHFFYDKIYYSKSSSKSKELQHIVQNNILKYDSSLDAIAGDLRISRRHLERVFKEHVGISPQKYQSILRFEKSIEMIKKGENLIHLTFELDYTDQSHFIKEFKKYSSLTPSQFLKMNAFESLSTFFKMTI